MLSTTLSTDRSSKSLALYICLNFVLVSPHGDASRKRFYVNKKAIARFSASWDLPASAFAGGWRDFGFFGLRFTRAPKETMGGQCEPGTLATAITLTSFVSMQRKSVLVAIQEVVETHTHTRTLPCEIVSEMSH
jgi:hypothetical protein